MKKHLLALVITSAVSTGAFAQAQAFQGFSVGINGSFVGNSTELSGDIQSTNLGNSNVVPTGEIGYTHAITNQFTLGISGTYDFTNQKLGNLLEFSLREKITTA